MKNFNGYVNFIVQAFIHSMHFEVFTPLKIML